MAELLPAQIAQEKATLAAIRAAFNANIAAPVNAASGVLNTLLADHTSAELLTFKASYIAVINALNAAIPPLHACIAANDAMPQPVDVPAEPAYVNGYLDAVTPDGIVTGWAIPSGVLLSIRVDGVEVGTERSHFDRPDVFAATGVNGSGWTFSLPASVDKNVVHAITVLAGIVPLHGGSKGYGGVAAPDAGSTTFVRFAPDMSNDASIQAAFSGANKFYSPGLPTVNVPSKWIDGLLEVPIVPGLNAGPGIGGTGASWQWWIPQTPAPPNELWCEYDFYIDPDVLVGFNEEGCKLPGLAGAWEQAGQWAAGSAPGWFSIRLWHRRPAANGDMEFCAYSYTMASHERGNPYGDVLTTGKMLRAGRKYKLGQHIKLNTQAVDGSWLANGVLELLLDGVVVYRDAALKVIGDVRATFQSFFVNIFHGGSIPPTAPIHYRIGGIIVDAKPIGGPGVILQGPVPSWRVGAPKNEFIIIPRSAPARTLGNRATFFDGSYSGLFNDRVNGAMYSAGSSGHVVGAQNGVYKVNLMVDAPAWEVLRDSDGDVTPGDRNAAYWPNGRPTGSHLYYCGQVVQIDGVPVLVRTVNVAGDYVGNAATSTDAFNTVRGDWDLNGGDWDAPAPTAYKEPCIALDARTNKIYRSDQGGLLDVLDCNSRTWTVLTRTGLYVGWRGMVVVPEWNALLWHAGERGDVFAKAALGTGTAVDMPYTWQGERGYAPSNLARALVLQERNNCCYTVSSQPEPDWLAMCRLDLATMKIKKVGQVAVGPTIYNRIEDFPLLGGMVYCPSFGADMQFFATE